MKKTLFLLCIMIITGTMFLSAEDVVWGSYYGENNFRIGVDADFESNGTDRQTGISPEAELMLWKPLTGSIAFLDAGAAVRGRFGLPLTGGSLSAGAGLLATVHFGFRGLKLPASEYLQRLDLYAETGVKFDFIRDITGLGFVFKSGVNYFLSDSIAVGAHYSSWGDYRGGGLSCFLKLGKTPVVKGLDLDFTDEVAGFAVQPYLLQFYTFYYSAHFAGGFYPDSFKEGQGCTHRISAIDESGESSYVVEKAYIMALSGNRRLWSLNYTDSDDTFYYEYITDENNHIRTVYYQTEDEGLLVLDTAKAMNPEPEYLGWKDYPVDSRRNVNIDVEAGRFNTTEYSYIGNGGADALWWMSEDVPGNLVSYKMEDNSDIVISELIDLNTGNKAKLYK